MSTSPTSSSTAVADPSPTSTGSGSGSTVPKKRPEKALYVPPGARREKTAAAAAGGSELESPSTDDNGASQDNLSCSRPPPATGQGSRSQQQQETRSSGGRDERSSWKEKRNNKAGHDDRDHKERYQQSRGSARQQNNYKGANSFHNRSKPGGFDESKDDMNGKARRINRNPPPPSNYYTDSSFSSVPPASFAPHATRYGASYKPSETGPEVDDRPSVSVASFSKNSRRIPKNPEVVKSNQEPCNDSQSAVQITSTASGDLSRSEAIKEKHHESQSVSAWKPESKDQIEAPVQSVSRPVTRRIPRKPQTQITDTSTSLMGQDVDVSLVDTSNSNLKEFTNSKLQSGIPSLDEAKQFFGQQGNVADALSFKDETENADNNGDTRGPNKDSLLMYDSFVDAPSADLSKGLTINTGCHQTTSTTTTTQRVKRMKPPAQKYDFNFPDASADMLRNNPKNRTLYDPNTPPVANSIPKVQEKTAESDTYPGFSSMTGTASSKFPAQYGVPQNAVNDSLNFKQNQTNLGPRSDRSPEPTKRDETSVNETPAGQSSLSTSSKPTAQVLPTPSTNPNSSTIQAQQKAAFMQQLQQAGISIPEHLNPSSEGMAEFAQMFMHSYQIFQFIKQNEQQLSTANHTMPDSQRMSFGPQQNSANQSQRSTSIEVSDFERFLTGNVSGNSNPYLNPTSQPMSCINDLMTSVANTSINDHQSERYIPKQAPNAASDVSSNPLQFCPSDASDENSSFHQFLTSNGMYPSTNTSVHSNASMQSIVPPTTSFVETSKGSNMNSTSGVPNTRNMVPLNLTGFAATMPTTTSGSTAIGVDSPSPSNEKMSAGLQLKIGEMCRMGNFDVNQLVSLETNNPKASFIRDKMLKQLTSQHVKESQMIEAQLEEMIKQGRLDSLKEDIDGIRNKFMGHCRDVIVYDSENAHNHNMEYVLWKNAFYILIERLRKLTNDQSWKYHAQNLLHGYLDEGIEFYQGILDSLQKTRNILLNDYLTPEVQLRLEPLPKKVLYVISSAFKLYIGLGDLYRYKEQIGSCCNFGYAKNAYLKAQQLLPKNGRAFNQLAILAWHLKRRFETVYYYMRSLAAQEDFKGARESLNSMFEDVAKKVKTANEKAEAKVNARIKEEQEKLMDMIKVRGKIMWVKNNRELPPADEVDMAERWRNIATTVQREMLLKLADSDVESKRLLNRQLVLSFLNIHGKLFTSIGMETFKQQFNQTAEEFKILLNHEPLSTPDERFLQLIIINIFAIYNTAKRGAEDNQLLRDKEGKVRRSEANVAAIAFGMMIAQKMVDKVTHILQHKNISLHHIRGADPGHNADQEVQGFLDFRTLFPAIKLWATWMMNNQDYWHPLPDCWGLLVPHSVWTSWSNLFNRLHSLHADQIPLSWTKSDDSLIVLLNETVSVAGFKPMNGFTDQPFYIPRNSNRLAAEHAYRCLFLLNFAKFLASSEVQVVYQSVTSMEYEASLPEINTPVKLNWAEECAHMQPPCHPPLPASHSRYNTESSDDGLLAELQSTLATYDMHSPKQHPPGGVASDSALCGAPLEEGGNMNYTELQLEKQRLESQHEAGLRMMQTKEMMLSGSRQKLRVEPLYVVIDTNAFIDHLQLVDRIACAKKYQVVVPLTVANELVGLSKPKQSGDEVWSIRARITGGDTSSVVATEDPLAASEAAHRAAKAEAAVSYIKEKLSEKPSHLKLKTFKGVLVHELTYKMPFEGSNDDAIIQTALHNIPSQENANLNRSDPIRRNVVLLTEDRNLMLKSINIHCLPATTITEFVKIYDL